jgi:hypothetical protein
MQRVQLGAAAAALHALLCCLAEVGAAAAAQWVCAPHVFAILAQIWLRLIGLGAALH